MLQTAKLPWYALTDTELRVLDFSANTRPYLRPRRRLLTVAWHVCWSFWRQVGVVLTVICLRKGGVGVIGSNHFFVLTYWARYERQAGTRRKMKYSALFILFLVFDAPILTRKKQQPGPAFLLIMLGLLYCCIIFRCFHDYCVLLWPGIVRILLIVVL